MKRSRVLVRGVLTAGGLLGAREACAQDLPDRVFAAQDALRRPGIVDPLAAQPRPELEAVGVRLGGYTLKAAADVAPVFNSNVRIRPDDDVGVGAHVAPQVRITSNGPQDPLVAFLAGTLTAYPGKATETVATLAGGVDVTRELSAGMSVRATAEAGRYFEDRSLSFIPNQSYRPVRFDRFSGSIGATANLGRLTVTPLFEVDRLVYRDGVQLADPSRLLVQRIRSLSRVESSLVVGYAVSDITAVYAGVNVNTRVYDLNERFDSHGYAAYGGVRLRPTALTRFDAAIGYQRQFYRAGFTDPKGLFLRVSGLYSPDRQTQVELSYRRDISETGGVQAGGLTRDRAGIAVRRELLRNFRIGGSAELRRFDFASIDRRDRRWFLGADARYIAGRDLELFVRADQVIARSSGLATNLFDFARTTLMSGVTLKL